MEKSQAELQKDIFGDDSESDDENGARKINSKPEVLGVVEEVSDDDEVLINREEIEKMEDVIDRERFVSFLRENPLEKQREEGEEEEDDEEEGEEEVNEELEGNIFSQFFKEIDKDRLNTVDLLKKKRKKEIKRARSVLNQKVLYDTFVKWRIYLQKPLRTGNDLPSQDDLKKVKTNEKDEENVSKEIEGLENDIGDTIKDLMEIKAMINKDCDQEFEESNLLRWKNMTLEDKWEYINGSYSKNVPNVYKSLNLWDRTTTLKNISNSKLRFRSINQTFERRVQAELDRNMKSLLLRSRERIVNEKVVHNNEIYEDNKFYQKLLKEFLLEVGKEGFAKGFNIEKELIRKVKKKKKTESNVSKNRKISYEVKQKLVGFMSREPFDYPRSADFLFGNLFGGNFLETNQKKSKE